MSQLKLDIQGLIKSINLLEESGKELEGNFSRLESSFESLGSSWRDREYEKLKNYISQADQVITSYTKSTAEYLSEVKPRIQKLEQEYSSESTSSDIGGIQLDDLNLDISLDETDKGLHIVTENNLYGFADETDQVVIPIVYDTVGEFTHEGLAMVSKNNTYGIIDTEGNLVNTLYYDEITVNEDGTLTAVKNNVSFEINYSGGVKE